MKYSALIVLMLFCGVAIGQSLFVGVRGGGVINSSPYRMPAAINLGDVSGRISYLCGFKAGADLKHVQAGVGADVAAYSYSINTGVQTSVASMPYIFPHGFANYKRALGKAYFYAGVNAGYYIAGETTTWDKEQKSSSKIKGGKIANGVSGGVQLGFSYPVTKKLHLQGEAGARYLPIKAGYTYYDALGNPIGQTDTKPVFAVPVTIGITYQISGN